MVDLPVIETLNFKGLEAVVLENEQIRCVILPSYGGKMVSFFLIKKQPMSGCFRRRLQN